MSSVCGTNDGGRRVEAEGHPPAEPLRRMRLSVPAYVPIIAATALAPAQGTARGTDYVCSECCSACVGTPVHELPVIPPGSCKTSPPTAMHCHNEESLGFWSRFERERALETLHQKAT